MMNKKIFTSGICTILFLVMLIPSQAYAQWGIGASYEVRQETPKNGFGLRIERGILGKVPVVDLRLRAHFSYFNKENSASSGGGTISKEITNYDFGLAAIGGVSLGLIKPYVGLGLGSTTFDLDQSNTQLPDDSDSKIFWNALAGVELSPIPVLKPFVEYRLQPSDEPDFSDNFDSNGRFVVGLTLNL